MQYQDKRSNSSTKRLAVTALFASLSLIFSYIEFLLPAAPGIPGVKLGLANLVIIVALYKMDARYAISINVLRVILAGMLFTGVFGMLYSLAGAIVSFFVMYIFYRTNRFSVIGVSMIGGVAHNLGQLTIAAFIVSSTKLFYYLPILIISGMIAGILIGIVDLVVLPHLPAELFRDWDERG